LLFDPATPVIPYIDLNLSQRLFADRATPIGFNVINFTLDFMGVFIASITQMGQ